jgi:hypothetical protein
MKRVFMLLLIINEAVFIFAQKTHIVNILWGNCRQPEILALDYVVDNEVIKIPYDNMVIVIHKEENRGQLIEVVKAEKVQYALFSKYIVDPFYLWTVYRIYLDTVDNIKILLVAYHQGTTGLSANMTFGILFDIANHSVQYLSSWGSVEENFRDIDNDGEYEFICVDYYRLRTMVDSKENYERLLVANIFERDDRGFFTKNISLNSETIFALSLEDTGIREINWKQFRLPLLKGPDVFEFDGYYRR